jgi:hypothetical protein
MAEAIQAAVDRRAVNDLVTPRRKLDTLVAGVAVALMLAAAGLAVTVSHARAFQVDEVEHIHAAYHLRSGRVIYSEFWETHQPLLYGLLAPLVDPSDPVATFRRARVVMLGVMFGSIMLAGWCARRLAGTWAGAVTAGLLLLHTTYVERGIEVRPDGVLALCSVLALAIELSSLPRRRRNALEALVLSAAFLATQKAVFVCFAFGCLWLVCAMRERKPGDVALPMAVWIAPLALTITAFALLGNLDDYLRLCYGYTAGQLMRSDAVGGPFPPWEFLFREASRNRFFSAASLAALAYCGLAVRRAYQRSGWAADRRLLFPAVLAATVLVALKLNPFPYPYLHVTALPVVAVMAGVFVGRAPGELARGAHPSTGPRLAIGSMLLASLFALPRLIVKAAPDTAYQFALLTEVQRATATDDTVFDAVGLYFRADAYPVFAMTHVGARKYWRGVYPPMIPYLREREVVAMMTNYRHAWLPRADQEFFQDHFVRYTGDLFLLGTPIYDLQPGAGRSFEVLKEKPFRYEGDGAISIDGLPFTRGVLAKGTHEIMVDRRVGAGRLIMDTPEPHPKSVGRRPYYPAFD